MSAWGKTVGLWAFVIIVVTGIVLMVNERRQHVTSDMENNVLARPPLNVAMSGVYPPFNYRNDQNQLVGFDVDIAKEIARRLDREPQLIATAWDGILAGLVTRKFDLIIGSMAITEERKRSVGFSDPYYISGAQIIAPNGSFIRSAADLKGKRVGVTLGETYEEFVRGIEGVGRVSTYKGGPPMLLIELNNKRIDAFVSDRLVGLYAIKQTGSDVDVAGELLYREEMGIAIHKDDAELLSQVNAALAAMKADGAYAEISTTWFGRDISDVEADDVETE